MSIAISSGPDYDWLRAAARRLNVSILCEDHQSLNRPVQSGASHEDEIEATRLVEKEIEIRNQQQRSKTIKLLQNKKKANTATFEDFTNAITTLVRTQGSAKVLEVLLQRFSDDDTKHAKTSILRHRKEVDEGARDKFAGALLIKAYTHGSFDIVHVLSQVADPKSVQNLLKLSMNARSLGYMEIALKMRADPNRYQDLWADAITRGDHSFIQLLVKAPVPMNANAISNGLAEASRRAHFKTLKVLLDANADTNVNEALAVALAADSGRKDLLFAMLLASKPPSADNLDRVVTRTLGKCSNRVAPKQDIQEILIHGGASGDGVADLLISAVSERLLDLCQLLIQKGASVQHRRGEAFKIAIKYEDPSILCVLNQSHLGTIIASHVFGSLSADSRYLLSSTQLEKLALILDQGACGKPLDKALVERVNIQDLPAAELLLAHGASVDYEGAKALKSAVSSGNLGLVARLLEYKPHKQSLAGAFPLIRENDKDTRFAMTKLFLSANTVGSAIDEGLLFAFMDDTESRDRELITALILGGADCDQKEGMLLHTATRAVDIYLLKILAGHSKNPSLLGAAVETAMSIDSSHQRYDCLKVLLDAHARGPQISQTLVDCVDGTPEGLQFSKLLIDSDGVNLDYHAGVAMLKATRVSGMDFLNLFVDKGSPSRETVESCFMEAMSLRQLDPWRALKLETLISQGVSGDVKSEALYQELCSLNDSGHKSTRVFKKLVEAGADINFDNGKVIRLAMDSNVPVLEIVLAARPSQGILDALFHDSCVATPRSTSMDVITSILTAGVTEVEKSTALILAVSQKPPDKLLINTLLCYDASVNYQKGKAIRHAVETFSDYSDLLPVLLGHNPNKLTLEAAWHSAEKLPPGNIRYTVLEILLRAGVTGDIVSKSLVAAVQQSDLKPIHLLLNHGGSVEYSKGAALRLATKKADMKLLQTLLLQKPSEQTISACFQECALLPQEKRLEVVETLLRTGSPILAISKLVFFLVSENSGSRDLIGILLDHGADISHNEYESVEKAASLLDHETLGLLLSKLQALPKKVVASTIFQKSFHSGNHGQSKAHHLTMRVLLQAGAKDVALNKALKVAVANAGTNEDCFAFVDDLLKAGADVDYLNGQSLRAAVDQGHVALVTLLLSSNVSIATLSRAFNFILASSLKTENNILELIDAFCGREHKPDVNIAYSGSLTPLVLALNRYSECESLITRLVFYGCNIDQTLEHHFFERDYPERVSLLCWIISQDNISDSTICLLIELGADPNATTSVTQSTPLILAAMRSRIASIQKLIEKGANVGWQNRGEESALFHASSQESVFSVEIVRQLIQAGSMIDDGSLHEAAKNLHIGVVQLLLKAGHNPNAVTPMHQGRGALAELCLHVMHHGRSQHTKQMMRLLIQHGADLTRKYRGKSILLLALDHSSPYTVTQALLNIFGPDYVNEDFHIYEFENHCYSPIEYVKRGLNKAPSSERERLVELLRDAECRIVFYALKGPQPPDFEGAPDYIRKAEIIRQAREARIKEEIEDHERSLALENSRAAARQKIMQMEHKLATAQIAERAEQQNSITQEAANLNRQIERTAALDRQAEAEHTLARQREHTRLMNQSTLEFEDKHRNLLLEHQRKSSSQEQAAMDAKMRSQKKYLEYETQQVEKRVAASKSLASVQQRLLESQVAAAAAAQSSSQLPQITYRDLD